MKDPYMNAYIEIYATYLRHRRRKTPDDVEQLQDLGFLLNVEGITLMQLRTRVYNYGKP